MTTETFEANNEIETEQPIIIYGRPNCPGVPPALRLLDAAGVAYEYVDIRQDPEAAARLRAITGGYESVPTLVFPDGRALVEPGTMKLRQALQEDAPDGEQVVSTADTVRAGLSNPVYIVLALLALALIISILVFR